MMNTCKTSEILVLIISNNQSIHDEYKNKWNVGIDY
jgi:hypothetical protein